MGERMSSVILLVLLTWGLVGLSHGQIDDPEIELPKTEAERLEEAHPDSLAVVEFQGRELFEVGSGGIVSARERAAIISAEIMAIATSHDCRPEDLRLVRDDRVMATAIVSDHQYVSAVWDYEAEVLGKTTEELATQRLEIIRQAVIEYRNDYSATSLIKSGVIAALVTFLYFVILRLIVIFRRRVEGMLEYRLEKRTLFKILKGEVLVGFVRTINRLVHFLTVLWLTLTYLNYLLSLFPWTYGIASRIFEMAAGPLRTFGKALVSITPSLFFLAFIIVLTVFALRGVKSFFDEVEKGKISFQGFYPDWAHPTFNIVRVVILAFAFIFAFPYIPGSGSDAFKGVSIFMGLLVSLGSGSAVANAISGIILIYMRPFSLGDRVRIGETIGDVIDWDLLTTRIRTSKNERITIPNNNILGGQIVNYTAKARSKELVLYTSVTIGYDVPFQQVEELLIQAAKETKNAVAKPEPFVLQKGLHDFYVEYEINIYTDKAQSMASTYSDLHRNIQIAFDNAEVEIMSPHGRMVRESVPKFASKTAPTEDVDNTQEP
jgi:small-conductance mechanosensitive channel